MLEKEAIEKGIDIEGLRAEQRKLAKLISCKDIINFKNATRFAAIETAVIPERREIVAAIAVLDENMNIVEEKFATDKISFPYIPGFRAYRELPVMKKVFSKLEENPDVIFVYGHGVSHPSGLGIASHFGLSVDKPTIGIANNLIYGEEKDSDVFHGKKIIARKIVTHPGCRAIYVSTGHLISLKTAVEILKRCLKEPHKLPEPMVKCRRYLDKICRELRKGSILV